MSTGLEKFEALVGRKDLCSPEVFYAWQEARDELLASLRRATWDLACRTFHGKPLSLGEEANALYLGYLDEPNFSANSPEAANSQAGPDD